VLQWGHGKGAYTNAHAGVAIGLHKGRFKKVYIRKVCEFPDSMQGRLGAVRIVCKLYDITLVVAYMPTDPSSPGQQKMAEAAQKKLDLFLSHLPSRTLPIILHRWRWQGGWCSGPQRWVCGQDSV